MTRISATCLLLLPQFQRQIISHLHFKNLSQCMSAYLLKGLKNIFKPLKKNKQNQPPPMYNPRGFHRANRCRGLNHNAITAHHKQSICSGFYSVSSQKQTEVKKSNNLQDVLRVLCLCWVKLRVAFCWHKWKSSPGLVHIAVYLLTSEELSLAHCCRQRNAILHS